MPPVLHKVWNVFKIIRWHIFSCVICTSPHNHYSYLINLSVSTPFILITYNLVAGFTKPVTPKGFPRLSVTSAAHPLKWGANHENFVPSSYQYILLSSISPLFLWHDSVLHTTALLGHSAIHTDLHQFVSAVHIPPTPLDLSWWPVITWIQLFHFVSTCTGLSSWCDLHFPVPSSPVHFLKFPSCWSTWITSLVEMSYTKVSNSSFSLQTISLVALLYH
jgi:hypothetical protein